MISLFGAHGNSGKKLTLAEFAKIIDASVPCSVSGSAVCGRILTQSEYVTPGDVVISAGWYEHNRIISQSLKKGALAVFCPESVKNDLFPDNDKVIAVNDPLACVQAYELWREKGCHAKRIVISGSVGKTTTTGLINAVITNTYHTLTHHPMSNSHGAILRNIQKLTPKHEWWVQEVGGVQPGYIESSACILRPDIAVLTNIGQSHLDKYMTRENILKDKGSLEKYLKPNGVVVINGDDDILSKTHFTHRVVTVSMKDPGADYYINGVSTTLSGIEFSFTCAEGNFLSKLNLYGDYNAYNGAMAIAVARLAGVPMERAIELIDTYTPSGMRQNFRNVGGYKMLIDCFNAEPKTVLGSAKTLEQMPVSDGGRRIFVTGHIDKLGTSSKQMHYALGEDLAKLKLDIIVLYGGDSDQIYAALKANGFESAFLMQTRDELDGWLRQNVTHDDVTFYKSGQFETALAKTIDHVYGTTLQNEQQFNEGYVVEKDGYKFRIRRDGIAEVIGYTGTDTRLVIPSGIENSVVIRIQSRAFSKKRNIVSVDIPDSVTYIGQDAFYACTALKEIRLPRELKFIDKSAFNFCKSLTAVTIPDGTLHMDRRTFYGCSGLKTMYIPDSVGFFGTDALHNSPKMTVICSKNSEARKYAEAQGFSTGEP